LPSLLPSPALFGPSSLLGSRAATPRCSLALVLRFGAFLGLARVFLGPAVLRARPCFGGSAKALLAQAWAKSAQKTRT
jgi:hypothetical protein